jgi:hypothetical protein
LIWRRILLSGVCAGAFLSGTALRAATPEPERIESELSTEGAQATVSRLWQSGDYDDVLRQMATGDERWVTLAPALAQGADAGAAEGLTIALAEALPRNAEGVLGVLDPSRRTLSPPRVCGAPFIEGVKIGIGAYLAEATRAVSAVSQARLQSAKAACLAALRQ